MGVEVVADGSPEVLRCEREVLVTSGGIGSPRLLLLSGIGPADHLRQVGVEVVHDLPGVGSNLQDHLDLYAMAECSGDYTYDNYVSCTAPRGRAPVHAVQARPGGLDACSRPAASGTPNRSASQPDIQFHLGLGSGIEAGVEKLKNPGVTLNSAFLRPRSRGTVRLSSADPADAPLIDPNYWSDPYDRRLSLQGLRMAREILQQPALRPFLLGVRHPAPELDHGRAAGRLRLPHLQDRPPPVRRLPMGTGAMAVVDPDLRVRGLEGLRVCDSSVMPRVPSSNTNAPTIMVGEKASDLVLGNRAFAPPLEHAA